MPEETELTPLQRQILGRILKDHRELGYADARIVSVGLGQTGTMVDGVYQEGSPEYLEAIQSLEEMGLVLRSDARALSVPDGVQERFDLEVHLSDKEEANPSSSGRRVTIGRIQLKPPPDGAE